MATDYSSSPALQSFVWRAESYKASFTVSFPKAPDMDLFLLGAELHQDIEQHDRLVLHFKGNPFLKRAAIVSGDPVIFTIVSGKKKTTWNGYVNHIDQTNTYQGGNTDMVCVGATWVLKDTDQKVYKNVTADQVVTQVCQRFGFEAVTQRHPRQRSAIVHSGESFWQLLRRLAKQTGCTLLSENTTIYFVSKDKIYQSKKNSAPYFKYLNDENAGAIPRERKVLGDILSFHPIISDQAPEAGVRVDRVITGTNHQTSAILNSTHKYKTPKTSTSGVVIPNPQYFQSPSFGSSTGTP